MRHAATKHIFSYWRRLRGVRQAPERADINPAEIGRYLADMIVLERRGAGDFRFRIAGSRICALYGMELRGERIFDAVFPAAEADLAEMISTVTDDGLPVIAGVSVILSSGMTLEAELLLLPLLHRGAPGERILGTLTVRAHERLSEGACTGLDILSVRVLNDADTRHLHPREPDLPFGMPIAERRGHLAVLNGGLQ